MRVRDGQGAEATGREVARKPQEGNKRPFLQICRLVFRLPSTDESLETTILLHVSCHRRLTLRSRPEPRADPMAHATARAPLKVTRDPSVTCGALRCLSVEFVLRASASAPSLRFPEFSLLLP